MKKGFSVAFANRDVEIIKQQLSWIAEAGFDGVEPTFLPTGLPSPESWKQDAALLAELVREVGLAIPSMRGGPLFWPRFAADEPGQRQAAVELAERAMRCVQEMGGEVLLIVPGQWQAGQPYDATLKSVRDTACRIAEVAGHIDITVGLENVENRLLFSPSEWCDLLDAVGHPRMKMYYDAGNTVRLRQGYSPDWIRQLGRERIARVHFKDAVEGERVAWLLEGDVDWLGVRQSLAEIGYDDWICAELDFYRHLPQRMLQKTARDMDAIWELGATSK